jgi:two-component system, response regulator YesN
MIRLLIVDDEKTTRESLARYIPWGAMDVGPVHVARNGVEALALADREPPEILLTDVRMPKMDGLELAERIRVQAPGCKIIFLSGYADKEYLKRAIQLRAISYVEKPIDLDEVKEAVRSAASACRKEAEERAGAERLRKRIEENDFLVRQDVTKALVTGSATASELHAAYPDIVPAFEPTTLFTAAAVTLQWKAALSEGDKAVMRRGVLNASTEVHPFRLPSSLSGFVDTDTLALVVARKVAEPGQNGRNAYHDLQDTLRETCSEACGVTIGVGSVTRGAADLPASYHSALRAARLSFYGEGQGIHFAASARQESFAVLPDLYATFQHLLHEGDVAGASSLLHDTSSRARALASVDVESVRDVFSRLFLMALESTRGGAAAPTPEIRGTQSLSDMEGLVLALVGAACGRTADNEIGSGRIREIQGFLRDNFADVNLSLQSIAERAGLSRTYLCALFKSATGTNIYEFVTRLRIEKAKELLRDRGIKTHEVAARVGYRDASYFSALFRKRVGSTPTDFRNAL